MTDSSKPIGCSPQKFKTNFLINFQGLHRNPRNCSRTPSSGQFDWHRKSWLDWIPRDRRTRCWKIGLQGVRCLAMRSIYLWSALFSKFHWSVGPVKSWLIAVKSRQKAFTAFHFQKSILCTRPRELDILSNKEPWIILATKSTLAISFSLPRSNFHF